jgi:hypothetical protein
MGRKGELNEKAYDVFGSTQPKSSCADESGFIGKHQDH